jgi:hypothetical protein
MVRLDARAVRFAAIHRGCAGYSLSPANTNTCNQGYVKINTVAGCQSAAAAIGKTYYGSVTYFDSAGGCYFFTGDSQYAAAVCFNTDLTGASHPLAQPLCAGAGPDPTSARRSVCVCVRVCLFVCRFGLFVSFVLVCVRAPVRAHTQLCVCAA